MARLAQSAERKALNLVVVGSSPTVGVLPVSCRMALVLMSGRFPLVFLPYPFLSAAFRSSWFRRASLVRLFAHQI